MRAVLLILAVLTLLITTISILYKRNKENSNLEINTTEIRVPKTIIDIGIQTVKTPVVGRFVIYNMGNKDLYIEKVDLDCHCTVGEYSKDPVRPKDSSIILLRYDSSRIGLFQSSAQVQTNSDQTPLLLVLRGNLIDSSLAQKK